MNAAPVENSPSQLRGRRRYRLHGLTLESDFEFPGWEEVADGAATDVVVRRGTTPANLPRPLKRGVCYEAQPGEMLLWLDGVARFHVVAGRDLVVEAGAASDEQAVQALVRSSPLAVLLLQRGLLPLHATAVAGKHGALVVLGSAGAGKSTLAAELWRRGYEVLSDDITALTFPPSGAPLVAPGSPHLRLWPDMVSIFGIDATTLPRVRPGLEKRILHCGRAADTVGPRQSAKLAGIVWLDGSDTVASPAALRPITGARSVSTLMDLIYRPMFVQGLAMHPRVFGQVTSAARSCPIRHAIRPKNRLELRALADRIGEAFAP